MKEISANQWDTFLSGLDDVHLLQTSGWGVLKSKFGWKPEFLLHENSGAQVLFRKLPLGLTFAYIPKGPVGKPTIGFWNAVHGLCNRHHAIFLKIEPNVWEVKEQSIIKSLLIPDGCIETNADIQPRNTRVINLQGTESQILAQMKQKTRYNIRLSQRKGISVRDSEDVIRFHKMLLATGERDGFGVHHLAYYQEAFRIFSRFNKCVLLMAEFEDEPIAGIMVFKNQTSAYYFYGASLDNHRDKMPTYQLQWEAIKWARNNGCRYYDLWGIPDQPDDLLERDFLRNQGGLWGVYRFKRGFGGESLRTAGSWDYVYKPWWYKIYLLASQKRNYG